jgi:hypothetical protein
VPESAKPFNLWRKRSYEPPIRAYVRGTIALMTLVLLILFAVYIIFEAADRNQLYVTVISTLLLNLTCSPTIAPRRLPKVKTPLSSPNSFGREHDVEVTPGSPLITFLVSAFSALLRKLGVLPFPLSGLHSCLVQRNQGICTRYKPLSVLLWVTRHRTLSGT